jgi:NNP family nitrate/nitrite transporter-like MFS transporter
MNNLYGASNPAIVQGTGAAAQVLVAGYTVPDAVKYVFLGPLIGRAPGCCSPPHRMGGAI